MPELKRGEDVFLVVDTRIVPGKGYIVFMKPIQTTMKINLLWLLIFILPSCVGNKGTTYTTTSGQSETIIQKPLNPYKTIIGTWKMESYQVYSSEPSPTENKDIVWEFQEGGKMNVRVLEGKTGSLNDGQYWINSGILKVNAELYMYSFQEQRGIDRMDKAKPLGDELWLDSNLDPSISAHGPLIHFTRIK